MTEVAIAAWTIGSYLFTFWRRENYCNSRTSSKMSGVKIFDFSYYSSAT